MKILKLVMFALLFTAGKVALSHNPTYILDANDPEMVAPNIFEFDIDLTWTNPGVAPNFEYSGGQYFFDVDSAIKNSGSMTYSIVGSDLPENMRPRSPTVFNNFSSSTYQLRLSVNLFPGAGLGYQMPANVPVKIVRMRLTTSTQSFARVPMNLLWRSGFPNPFTKIFAYVGTTNRDVSTPSTHRMSISGYFVNIPYRVTIKLGIEGLINNNLHLKKDSVTIYIRSASPPFQVIDSGNSALDSVSFTASIVSILNTGNYYIVVKHRNSLETWSKSGGEPLGSNNYLYDFTTSASQAYGNNLTLRGNVFCIFSGNVNGDDSINSMDLQIIESEVLNFTEGRIVSDLNGDQIVDATDLAICDDNARAVRTVMRPEAASILHSTLSGESNLQLKFEQFVKP